MLTKPPRSRRGQSRILEAVIAAVVIFITFSVASFMIQANDVKVLQEGGDLDRLGYNVLSTIVESGVIDTPNTPQRNIIIATALQANLPSAIYYNFTIYDCTNTANGIIQLGVETNVKNVLSFANSTQVSSASTMYTNRNGLIRQLILVLARAGGQ
jgi:hypothetical protein